MEETKRCPYCGEEILATAKKCKHCGEWQEEKPANAAESIQPATARPAGTATPPPASPADTGQTADSVPSLIERYYVEVFFRHYADFKGKLPRKQFWIAYLFYTLSIIPLLAIDMMIGFPVLLLIYLLATIVPSIAASVRRLHDMGTSGWWYLISLIPTIGNILLLILLCQKGKTDTRPAKAKPSDWIALAIAVVVSIVGFAVGTNKMAKLFSDGLTGMVTESMIVDEMESEPEAPEGATLAGVSTDGNYWYYLKEGENNLYQIDKSTKTLYTINMNEAFDDVLIYSIEDYTVYGNKLFFITYNGGNGMGSACDAFYFDMDNEKWQHIAFAKDIEFNEDKTVLKPSSPTSEDYESFEEHEYDLSEF